MFGFNLVIFGERVFTFRGIINYVLNSGQQKLSSLHSAAPERVIQNFIPPESNYAVNTFTYSNSQPSGNCCDRNGSRSGSGGNRHRLSALGLGNRERVYISVQNRFFVTIICK